MGCHQNLVGLIVVAGVLYGGVAHAQRKDGGYGWPANWSPIRIAGLPAVQAELGLEGEPLARVQKILGTFKDDLKAENEKAGIDTAQYTKLSAEQRTLAVEKRAELSEKFVLQLKEVLTPDQFDRLRQINWQQAGVPALWNDAELAELLDLTKEQKDELLVISRDFVDKVRDVGRPGSGKKFPELQATSDELRKERDRKAIDVLTKDQQEKYTKLKGAPFHATKSAP